MDSGIFFIAHSGSFWNSHEYYSLSQGGWYSFYHFLNNSHPILV